MTRTPLSRSKGQGHQAALLTAMLTRQAAAAVSVGMYWVWETTATLRSAQWHKALQRPQREERGGGISWRPPDYSLLDALLAVRKLKSYLYAELFSTIVTVAIHCEIITVTEHLSQCRTVVPHCCKGDAASRWEMAILGVSELRNPEPID